ncbi:MAG: type II toxin-antitoxin system VapC family toxin [Microcoleaceae cyanobacterium]
MVSLRYLLDTNIISEPLRSDPNPQVISKLIQHSTEIAIAAVTWHELCYGYYRLPNSRRKDELEIYLNQTVKSQLPILPYDADAAEWFASERARLAQIGCSPSFPDGQIASVAHSNQLILVTRNISDFANFSDLAIENWFEEAT